MEEDVLYMVIVFVIIGLLNQVVLNLLAAHWKVYGTESHVSPGATSLDTLIVLFNIVDDFDNL